MSRFMIVGGVVSCLLFLSMTCKSRSSPTDVVSDSFAEVNDSLNRELKRKNPSWYATMDSLRKDWKKRKPWLDTVPPPEQAGRIKTYRDVPLPPADWNMILPEGADTCARVMFKMLKTIYPVVEDDYWDYNIYGMTGEPEDLFEARAFRGDYMDFFNDTIVRLYGWNPIYEKNLDCVPPDSTFFLQTLGEPTCKSFHYGSKLQFTTFEYYIRLRWRNGPCAHIRDAGTKNEQRCVPYHFDYCRKLLIRFSHKTGNMGGLNAF